MPSVEHFGPARVRDCETVAIRRASFAFRVAPVLHASSLPPLVHVGHFSVRDRQLAVRDRQLAVRYAGPTRLSQQAIPTAVAQAQSDAHLLTVQFHSLKDH